MSRIQIEDVIFDPKDPEHLKAFEMQCLGVKQPNGVVKHIQHPSLRFKLEKPFTSVNTMMFDKVSRSWLNLFNLK